MIPKPDIEQNGGCVFVQSGKKPINCKAHATTDFGEEFHQVPLVEGADGKVLEIIAKRKARFASTLIGGPDFTIEDFYRGVCRAAPK